MSVESRVEGSSLIASKRVVVTAVIACGKVSSPELPVILADRLSVGGVIRVSVSPTNLTQPSAS